MPSDDAAYGAPAPQRAERDGDDASVASWGRKAQSHRTKDSSSERASAGVANRVNGFFGARFHRLGRLSASRPWTVMACSMLFCILCAVGLGAPGLKNEKRGDKLWVPTDTPAQGDKNVRRCELRLGDALRAGDSAIDDERGERAHAGGVGGAGGRRDASAEREHDVGRCDV